MAINADSFKKGTSISKDNFNALKTLINTEVNGSARREQGYTIVNDVTNTAIDDTQINNLIGALNKIKQDYTTVLQGDLALGDILSTLYTRIELLRTTYPNKKGTTYPNYAGCGGACRGLCSGCTGGCSSSCSGTCSGSCSGGCSGDCSSCAYSCGSGCGSICGGGCEGFSYSCNAQY